MKSYFENEAVLLTKENTLADKAVSNDTASQSKTNIQVDWKKEFAMFIESDLNKPAWKISYSADTVLIEDTLYYSYKALEDKLKIRLLQIAFYPGTDSVISIDIHQKNTNNLYNSERYLHYNPRTGYHIKGNQKIRGIDKHFFSVEVRFRQN